MTHELLEGITKIWNDLPVDVLIASIVDPRTKSLKHLDESNSQEAWVSFEEEYDKFSSLVPKRGEKRARYEDEVDVELSTDLISKKSTSERKTSETIIKLEKLLSRDNQTEGKESEIEQWKKLPQISLNMDPLVWWSSNENKYPVISLIAKQFLAIPASQCTTERMFSKSGKIVSDLRCSLDANIVAKLTCLQKNKDIYLMSHDFEPADDISNII